MMAFGEKVASRLRMEHFDAKFVLLFSMSLLVFIFISFFAMLWWAHQVVSPISNSEYTIFFNGCLLWFLFQLENWEKTRMKSENRTTEIRRRQTHVNVIKVWPLNSKIYIFSILTYLLEFVGFEIIVILG